MDQQNRLSPANPGNFFHSVRFRLTMWFALVLVVVLLVFSAFVYAVETQAARTETAARLNLRVRDIQDVMRRASHESDDRAQIDLQNYTLSGPAAPQGKEILLFTDPGGQVTGAGGPLTSQQAAQVSQLAPSADGARLFSKALNISTQQSTRSITYYFATLPFGLNGDLSGWIMVGQPLDPDGELPRLLVTLALASLATLGVALAGGYWLAGRALWPVKAITRTAREISETDLSQRMNIQTRDELGELARTFDRMLDRLQAAFNRQRQFTADASHELRTPLTIIGVETDRALAARRTPEDYQNTLQIIHSENEFMTNLVSELLTLARMDAGQVKIDRQPIDLSDVTLEVVERYSRLAARKGIDLQTGALPELPIRGDRQHLFQMISNLVDNAIKYTPAGPDRWVRVETGLRAGDGRAPAAWVRVSDNGMGVAADHIPHLFDRFYRADTARSHNIVDEGLEGDGGEIPGSGLGLAIAQWVAEMHQGKISVQSRPDQGAAFEVEIPV